MNQSFHTNGKVALIETLKQELLEKTASIDARSELTEEEKDSRKEELRETYGAKISAERRSRFKLF